MNRFMCFAYFPTHDFFAKNSTDAAHLKMKYDETPVSSGSSHFCSKSPKFYPFLLRCAIFILFLCFIFISPTFLKVRFHPRLSRRGHVLRTCPPCASRRNRCWTAARSCRSRWPRWKTPRTAVQCLAATEAVPSQDSI